MTASTTAADEVESARQRGRTLFAQRQFQPALDCWQRVDTLSPGDAEAARIIAQITIQESRVRAGLTVARRAMTEGNVSATPAIAQGNGQARGTARPTGGVVPPDLPATAADLKRSPIQQLEAAVREFPARADLYLQLTPLYLEKGRDYDAERLLAKGREATDNDPRVYELWEDVTLIRWEKKIELARQQLAAENTTAFQAELAAAISERDRLATEFYVNRCKRDPENAGLRYQLGLRLLAAGRMREARPHFESALADPQHKPAAALALARGLAQSHEPAQALRFYRLAADSAICPDHRQHERQALAEAARLAAAARLLGLARWYLDDLLRLDPAAPEGAALRQELEQTTNK